jgi:hypothetical protein
MNTATAVALLVSILGFFTIVAIAFLCHKFKATKSISIPASPIHGQLNSSTLSLPLSFLARPTNYVTIRRGQVVNRSQASTPSIRSCLTWNRSSRLQSTVSLQSSQHDLRSAASRDQLRTAAARDLEAGVIHDAPPVDLSSPTTPTLSRHPNRLQQYLPAVPELAQPSPPRGVPSHEQLRALGTGRPPPHVSASPIDYAFPTHNSFTATPRDPQQYQLPSPPVRTKSTTTHHEDVNHYHNLLDSPVKSKSTPRIRTYELHSTPSSPTTPATSLKSRFHTHNHEIPATPDSKEATLRLFSPDESPILATSEIATSFVQTPGTASGHDETARSLLKSKYYSSRSWI